MALWLPMLALSKRVLLSFLGLIEKRAAMPACASRAPCVYQSPKFSLIQQPEGAFLEGTYLTAGRKMNKTQSLALGELELVLGV